MNPIRILYLSAVLLSMFSCAEKIEPLYPEKVVRLQDTLASGLAAKIRQEVAVEVADGLELSLWASDSLVHDPIAISIDPKGRVFYTSATRQSNSEFDIRGHQDWMTASISFQTVEDRRAFLRKTFSETNEQGRQFLQDLNQDGVLDWRDLAVEKEQVWFVSDSTGDGFADRAQLYLEDFNEEITDVANGIEYHDGEVFIAVGPDMWRSRDRDQDGIADARESISHGYAVHIGFSGHGMSGAKIGPDGRIWWGIGDIGMNVVDKEGKRWKYPNQGVIVRSELDGSGFEVYSAGLRNTHEFVFDQYGNLITEDNDGDHEGERERLVYLINGSDCGWRINWQFGKYTDPDNNRYKVWMDEGLSTPRWEGQPAYILPPIANYVNGPTGMVYNPGTALGEQWYNHFFIAEFRGSPANSPLHAFTLKPNGAGFELDKTQEVVKGLLPTGVDFGPDGALYFSDWITGWGTKDAGRIWKLDVPGGANSAIRQETKSLLQSDLSKAKIEDLQQWLGHQDMRVRQNAQFELVKRGAKGRKVLLATARESDNQLARIHGLWGLGQLARKELKGAADFLPFLQDKDTEIVTQAVKMLGDVRYAEAGEALLPLLRNPSLRLRLHTTEALGRLGHKPAVKPLLDMLRENDDKDTWLRHAGAIALSRIGEEAPLKALSSDPSKAMRTVAVVALRRMSSPAVADFLKDQDPYIVTEAARAINDDESIEAALPALAQTLADARFTGEPLLRRAINANLRVGKPENLQLLVNYLRRTDAPAAMRAEALAALGTWAKPSVHDRVDGIYRGEISRDAAPARQALQPMLNALLNERNPEVQTAAARAAAKLNIGEAAPTLLAMVKKPGDGEVRRAALEALHLLKAPSLAEALQIAIADRDQTLRSAAVSILPESGIAEDKAVALFQGILKSGSIEEKQAALTSLGAYQGPQAVATLGRELDQYIAGKLPSAIRLDAAEAVETQKNPELLKKLESYRASLPKDDALALYRDALEGGKGGNGWNLFNSHPAGQCIRCHSVFEVGGNAGPNLLGVGSRLSREELLRSMIEPSAVLSAGYGVVILEMKGGETISGVVLEENDTQIRLQIGKQDIRTVEKAQIASRENIPSSMPPMGEILSKREIRNLIEFLSGLKAEDI